VLAYLVMAVDYHIDSARRRVTLVISGSYAIDEVEGCYARLFADALFRPGYDLLIDGRTATGTPATMDLRARARRASELKGRFSGRIALVAAAPDIVYALARMYAVYAEEHGVAAQVFTALAEAERWLETLRAGDERRTSTPPAAEPGA
jgi:hypothetical protein